MVPTGVSVGKTVNVTAFEVTGFGLAQAALEFNTQVNTSPAAGI